MSKDIARGWGHVLAMLSYSSPATEEVASSSLVILVTFSTA